MSYQIPNPKKGIAQLEALIATLTEVKEDQERNILNMEEWVEVHTCGTAACICGYQALSGNLQEFDGGHFDLECLGSEIISLSLSSTLGEQLAESIWSASPTRRYSSILDLGVFSQEEFLRFGHVRDVTTTFEAAIEYMNAIIIKIKQQPLGE